MSVEQNQNSVLGALATYKAMPFLELSYASSVSGRDLDEVVEELKTKRYVEVSGAPDDIERMVNLTDLGLKIVRRSPKLRKLQEKSRLKVL